MPLPMVVTGEQELKEGKSMDTKWLPLSGKSWKHTKVTKWE